MSDDLEKTSQLKVTGLMLKAKSDEAKAGVGGVKVEFKNRDVW